MQTDYAHALALLDQASSGGGDRTTLGTGANSSWMTGSSNTFLKFFGKKRQGSCDGTAYPDAHGRLPRRGGDVDQAAPGSRSSLKSARPASKEDGVPGKKAGYHVGSGWFILGELVRRLDGRPFEQYVRAEIFRPLEMFDSWVRHAAGAAYREYGTRIGLMHSTDKGGAVADFFADSEAGATVCRPAGNGRGPVRELGRFYEMLLNRGRYEQRKILVPQTVEAMTARHRVGMFDHTFKMVVDWGLGFILQTDPDGTDPFAYGFGPSGPRTFGHGGFESSAGFADPETGLVVAFVFNGTPGEQQHKQRRRALQLAISQDRGLAKFTAGRAGSIPCQHRRSSSTAFRP